MMMKLKLKLKLHYEHFDNVFKHGKFPELRILRKMAR